MLLAAGVSRNLLVRFVSDQIDETPQLASMLQTSTVATSSTSSSLSLTVRNLPGDHVRPLRQAFRDLPPELAQVATQAVSQGSDLLRGLSQMAMQAGLPQVRPPTARERGLLRALHALCACCSPAWCRQALDA